MKHHLTCHSFPNRFEGFCRCGHWAATALTPENLQLAFQQHMTNVIDEPVERFVMMRIRVPYHMTYAGDSEIKRWITRALNREGSPVAGVIAIPLIY